MENKKPKILAVVGPTASGKTSLAIKLAQKYNGEVISADSMQIYKGMDIATAKPDKEEMQGIPHHLIDFLDSEKEFSVSDFTRLASESAEDILSRGKLPILCGGAGLYVRSFSENIQLIPESENPKVRRQLEERYQKEGGEVMLSELAKFDPVSAENINPNSRKRLIRAFEIYLVSGLTMTEQIKRSKEVPSPYEWIFIGLCFADRQKLYDRINMRVDIMIENGLLEETKKFYSESHGKTASVAIGYKELLPYIEGRCTLDEAVESLKRETRRYAKRQLTWFRRDKNINWIEADKVSDVFKAACDIFEKNI